MRNVWHLEQLEDASTLIPPAASPRASGLKSAVPRGSFWSLLHHLPFHSWERGMLRTAKQSPLCGGTIHLLSTSAMEPSALAHAGSASCSVQAGTGSFQLRPDMGCPLS